MSNDNTTYSSANAVLTQDIVVNEGDVSGCDGNKAEGWKDWTPIGNFGDAYFGTFVGTFDGQNHTISGLYFNDSKKRYVGLVSHNTGTIQNVGVVNSYFKGDLHVSGMCGYNGGTIKNSYNAGTISCTDEYAGGMCGDNYGTIENSYNTGTISGKRLVGGVCGYNGGTIENSYNTETISGENWIGGVCGSAGDDAKTTNCYNIGTVFGTDSRVGGVYGYNNNDTVANCYYLDTCAAEGTTFDNTDGTSKTADEFASGEVAYLLNGDQSDIRFYQTIGNDAFPTFDNTHSTVYAYTDCGVVKYTNTETADIPHDYKNGFCTQKEGETHYQPATLNETTGNYEISNAGQLYWFAAFVNTTGSSFDDYPNKNASAVLKKDIVINEGDLSGYDGISANSWRTWTPIGKFRHGYYTGTFDGQGHTISGLYCDANSRSYTGLFEYNRGIIQNVGIVNSYFKSENSVSGVCGNNEKIIKNCYYTGTVSGADTVGGVCGLNCGTLENCYNTGTISGTGNYIGGVCGDNYIDADDSSNNGIVKNSYYLDTCAAEGLSLIHI